MTTRTDATTSTRITNTNTTRSVVNYNVYRLHQDDVIPGAYNGERASKYQWFEKKLGRSALVSCRQKLHNMKVSPLPPPM